MVAGLEAFNLDAMFASTMLQHSVPDAARPVGAQPPAHVLRPCFVCMVSPTPAVTGARLMRSALLLS